MSNLKIENSSIGPWSNSEDGGISCHQSRFIFPQDTNKMLGPATSPCCILEIPTSMKENLSDFQYICSEICHRISIKSYIYAILPMTSISGLYDFMYVYRDHDTECRPFSQGSIEYEGWPPLLLVNFRRRNH